MIEKQNFTDEAQKYVHQFQDSKVLFSNNMLIYNINFIYLYTYILHMYISIANLIKK